MRVVRSSAKANVGTIGQQQIAVSVATPFGESSRCTNVANPVEVRQGRCFTHRKKGRRVIDGGRFAVKLPYGVTMVPKAETMEPQICIGGCL